MNQYSQDHFDAAATDDGVHDRNESRDSLFVMADFRLEGSATVRALRVRNLSAGGLMAEFPDGLAQGLRVEFDVRGIGWVPGQVAWSAAGRIGVAFDRQIDPLLARKPVGKSGSARASSKPVLPRGKLR